MNRRQPKLTAFAQACVDLSMRFCGKFLSFDFDGYRAIMAEPEGVSTEGGKQALQHIVLERESGSKLTVGSVNVVTNAVKLRTYECMVGLHELRFRGREPFPVTESAYQTFFDEVREFMAANNIQVILEHRPPEATHSSRPPARHSSPMLAMVLLVLLLVVAAAVVTLLFFYRDRLF